MLVGGGGQMSSGQGVIVGVGVKVGGQTSGGQNVALGRGVLTTPTVIEMLSTQISAGSAGSSGTHASGLATYVTPIGGHASSGTSSPSSTGTRCNGTSLCTVGEDGPLMGRLTSTKMSKKLSAGN